MRHGPTDWNAVHRYQGQTDRPLSRLGRELVARYRLPADVGGYRRLASPMLRARQTATILFGPGTPVEPRLREMTFGAWDGYTMAEIEARWGDAFRRGEATGWAFRPPGGESPEDVRRRLAPLLAEIADGGRATLIVAHRQVIRTVYAWAVGWDMIAPPPEKLKLPRLHRFSLTADGTPRPLSLNEGLGV